MPWLAMPYDRRDAKTQLSHKFKVQVRAWCGYYVGASCLSHHVFMLLFLVVGGHWA